VRGYRHECDDTQVLLAIAQGQLNDYEARIGVHFTHADYENQLADLCDRLKLGLSDKAGEGDKAAVGEVAEWIKALRAANSVEGAPERTGSRRVTRAEQPVTARIRPRMPWMRLLS
jgi:hypothetical protein